MIPAHLISGQKYLVTYQIEGVQRVPRQGVFIFLENLGTESLWHGRPEFGDSRFENKWIKSVASVDITTTCYHGRKVKMA